MITQQHQNRLVAQGRDELMTAWMKALPSAPTEEKQREASERFLAFMQELVPQIVGVVAVGDYPSFAVKLENIDGKGKIALKAANVDDAGPALITHIGASLTLVLTNAEQFDRKRPAATIEPDQRAMFEEGEDEPADEEVEALSDPEPCDEEGDTDRMEAGDDGAPLFSVVDVGFKSLPDGSEVSVHVLLFRDEEVFEPLAAPEFVQSCADKLNDIIDVEMTPFVIRDIVLSSLPSDNSIGVSFKGRFTTEAIQNSGPVEKASRRGRLSEIQKVELYHLGYDAAQAGQSISEVSTGDTDGAAKYIQRGWADQKDGKPRAWERPIATPTPANDDDATSADSEAA